MKALDGLLSQRQIILLSGLKRQMTEAPPRLPVWGKTYTKGVDSLLDAYSGCESSREEAVKQLGKIAFAHPDIAYKLNQVINILTKGK